MAQYFCDFTDPLDEIDLEINNLPPEPYKSTPEMREKLRKNLIEEGHLEVVTYIH